MEVEVKTKNWYDELCRRVGETADYLYEGIHIDVVESIAGAMYEKGWKNKDLANRIGASPQFIKDFLGGGDITIRDLLDICVALEKELVIEIKTEGK
jgi:DNA-binding Xre family transcriptional regulator